MGAGGGGGGGGRCWFRDTVSVWDNGSILETMRGGRLHTNVKVPNAAEPNG